MTSRIHELKTWPEPFQATLDGKKLFEVRVDDRGYAVGDILHLREFDPSLAIGKGTFVRAEAYGYTERDMFVEVTYVLHGGRFGLPENLCVMGIKKAHRPD